MNPSLTNPTAQQLRKAATLKEQIETLEREMVQLLGGRVERADGAGRKTETKNKRPARAAIAAG